MQRRNRDFWKQLVTEYEQVAATQTLRAFAKSRGVSENQLSGWRGKLRRENQLEQRLVPLVVRPTRQSSGAAVIIRLGAEPRLEVLDHARVPTRWLAELIHELARVSG